MVERLALGINIDLEGASKSENGGRAITKALEQAVSSVVKIDSSTTYLGDGYFVLIFDSDAARLPDIIFDLRDKLEQAHTLTGLRYRVGVDFGLVELTENETTKKHESFSEIGILAARLQEGGRSVIDDSENGIILLSERVYSVFSPAYQQIFSDQITVDCKDRRVRAYQYIHSQGTGSTVEEFRKFISCEKKCAEYATVIHADDEVRVLATFKEWADICGVGKYIGVADGIEALKALDEYPDCFVIADLMMPNMNGFELIDKIYSLKGNVPVAICSAWNERTSYPGKSVTGHQVYSFIPKPCLSEEIMPVFDLAGACCHFKGVSESLIKAHIAKPTARVREKIYLINHSNAKDGIISKTTNVELMSIVRHGVKNILDSFFRNITCLNEDSISSLGARIDKLYYFTQLEMGGEPFKEYVEGCLEESCKHRGIQWHVDVTDRAKHSLSAIAEAWMVKLKMSVFELIANAADNLEHIDKQKEIFVTSEITRASNKLRLIVSSNSGDIPRDIKDNIFEPGVTGNSMAGRGYGLYYVKSLVESIGGQVFVTTSNGFNRFIIDIEKNAAR